MSIDGHFIFSNNFLKKYISIKRRHTKLHEYYVHPIFQFAWNYLDVAWMTVFAVSGFEVSVSAVQNNEYKTVRFFKTKLYLFFYELPRIFAAQDPV